MAQPQRRTPPTPDWELAYDDVANCLRAGNTRFGESEPDIRTQFADRAYYEELAADLIAFLDTNPPLPVKRLAVFLRVIEMTPRIRLAEKERIERP